MQCQDLTAIEEAEVLEHLMKGGKYNKDQLAVIAGKARSTATEIPSLRA
ncbi:MAG: hypothetical protein ACYDH8_03655 [Syntrophales bacterium]